MFCGGKNRYPYVTNRPTRVVEVAQRPGDNTGDCRRHIESCRIGKPRTTRPRCLNLTAERRAAGLGAPDESRHRRRAGRAQSGGARRERDLSEKRVLDLLGTVELMLEPDHEVSEAGDVGARSVH